MLDPKSVPGYSLLLKTIAYYRKPPFLLKNIDKGLSLLEQPSGAASKPSTTASLTQHLDRATWKPPDPFEMRVESLEKSVPRLKIEVSSLQPRRRDADLDAHEPAESTRKRCKVVELECWIEVEINA